MYEVCRVRYSQEARTQFGSKASIETFSYVYFTTCPLEYTCFVSPRVSNRHRSTKNDTGTGPTGLRVGNCVESLLVSSWRILERFDLSMSLLFLLDDACIPRVRTSPSPSTQKKKRCVSFQRLSLRCTVSGVPKELLKLRYLTLIKYVPLCTFLSTLLKMPTLLGQ